VQVSSIWHLGTVLSLRQFLDRPCLRVLRPRASELQPDCVDQLRRVADWLRRLHQVELFASNPNLSAASRLVAGLAADPSLKYVRWRGRGNR
jgi:hypothetical protein